jgi:alpha-tubulin suppressor-like RCC1 family protein
MKSRWALIQTCLLGAVLLHAITSGAQPVTKIATGGQHSMFLKSDGSLWAMGDNSYGQLGFGPSFGTNRPEMIVASNVTAIAAGYYHSLFLKNDGSLWGMGANEVGELGDGTTNNIDYPEQLVPSGVTAIAAGVGFSIFTKNDGSLWLMGFTGWQNGQDYNSYGIYNIFPTDYTTSTEQIVSGGVTAIAAGEGQVLFLRNGGELWSMGYNGLGQLGDGTLNSASNPQLVVPGGVMAVAAGAGISLFLKSDGSMWGMGYDSDGELGSTNNSIYLPPSFNVFVLPQQIVSNDVTAIAADSSDSIFLKSDGSLWGLGRSSDGQLGVGGGPYSSPVQIVPAGVTTIAAGTGKTLFIKNDGSLWGMGDNQGGGLGLGDYDNLGDNVPESVNQPMQIVAAPLGFNQISIQLLSGRNVVLSFLGLATTNYALDLSFTLNPASWVPQTTNQADSFGMLVFTNTPDPTTNNFWRIRSVP